ncbi:hypothetical protein SAMN05421858_3503 [Haladaptatus litoreus]|uniref:Uncharacterized protein n=1 Tax=Haladaptatus litoreus TaxID=553468 RepID=A0A1N7DC42_9EURY|nr:hypothetical protein SAMN05421858_3503 [Haladaptatus litoreus]
MNSFLSNEKHTLLACFQYSPLWALAAFSALHFLMISETTQFMTAVNI